MVGGCKWTGRFVREEDLGESAGVIPVTPPPLQLCGRCRCGLKRQALSAKGFTTGRDNNVEVKL